MNVVVYNGYIYTLYTTAIAYYQIPITLLLLYTVKHDITSSTDIFYIYIYIYIYLEYIHLRV